MTEHARAQAFLAELTDDRPQLPFDPALVADLFASTGEESLASISQIAALVNRSQNLAAQVLRLANSSYYGFGAAVSSLSTAIRLLGLREIRSMVIGCGAAATLKKMSVPKTFALRQTWTHQVLTALFARELAQLARETVPALHRTIPDELYTAGLLHDLGKVLVASKRPQDWLSITTLAVERDLPFHLAEDAYWGIDHSIVGARLLAFWQLPPRLTELVGWHHAPDLADGEFRPNARLLAAANILADAMNGPGQAGDAMPAGARELLPAEMTDAQVMPRLAALLARDKADSLSATLVA
jgi:HD-like signal output (HDOD) protein